jgi:protein involved in polysaccharide export with SLBB domain
MPQGPQQTLITNTNGSYAAPVRTSGTGNSASAEPDPDQANSGSMPMHGFASSVKSRAVEKAAPLPKAAAERTEFQKFIAENTGLDLPIFGRSFFTSSPSTFTPLDNTSVPADYRLGPGDEILIRGWGTIDIDYRATIDRNGMISLPTIGTIALAGIRAADADSIVLAAVAKLYKGVSVKVSFIQLRAITVYVVGQALHPGTYTVSGLSTLVTALFASGGPNSNGSLRSVQLKRSGKVIAELDLYEFLANGDKSADVPLRDGDSIYLPPAAGHVALIGKVNAPAVYELKPPGDTVQSLLKLAGGPAVVADPRRAFLERIAPTSNRPRTVEEFALDAQGLARALKNGDVLNVTAINADFANAVVLRGHVSQAVRAPFRDGMRVSDLLTSRDTLVTGSSTKRQNSIVRTNGDGLDTRENENTLAARIGDLADPVNWEYAVIERVNPDDLSVSLIPFNLGNVFSESGGSDNVRLQPGDTVTIFGQNDVAVPMDKRRIFVRIEGEVKTPGVYQMTASDTLQGLVEKAGGPTNNAYLFGASFYRESVRRDQQANLERVTEKLDEKIHGQQANKLANTFAGGAAEASMLRSQSEAQVALAKQAVTRLRQLKATGRVALGLDPRERSVDKLPKLKLENGDRLVIPAMPQFAHVFGAVSSEASAVWRPNTKVGDYLDMAGVTTAADLDNVFVIRVDGTVVARQSRGWLFGDIRRLEVMPGDTIVVPEKLDKDSTWTKIMQGTREWAQLLANLGLTAAAISSLNR